MSDFTLQPHHTIIVGMTGSGKTTFVIKYLLNDEAVACRFIYDDLNRMWPRLKIPACHTPDDLAASVSARWSAFVPLRLLYQFGGDKKKVFRWWLKWVWERCHAGPGKKVVVLPEVWQHCNADSIPLELALLAQAGRELNVELVCDTQKPELLNSSLTGAMTEMVVFKQMSTEARRVTEKLLMESGNQFDPEQLRQLPLGSFIGFNRLSGVSRAGKLF